MERFWRRVGSVCLLIMLVVVTACGNNAPAAQTGSSSTSGSASSGSTSAGQPSEAKAEEKIVIKFPFVTSMASEKGKAAEIFKQLAEERTNGRVEVELYPSGQLMNDEQSLEQLPRNTIQFIAVSLTKLVSYDPRFQIVDLPFLFDSEEAFLKFWDGEAGEILGSKLESANLKFMGVWTNGFKQFVSNKKLLKTPDDFKGLKFRTQAGKVLEQQFSALGAGSVTLPFSEVYTALQQGTIDGIENTFVDIYGQNFFEVAKYLTLSNHGRLDYGLVTNLTFWNGLPDDIRGILEEVIAEVTEKEREIARDLGNQYFEEMKDQFAEIYEPTPADIELFKQAMQPLYDDFKNEHGDEILNLAFQANQ